mmetsp:Transcript_75927/g.201433  ORF Transcript_75927/g.201433 Transcript_75927/m.201433 type:complete len:383 (+) Transcript_75927:740-1888(+)
MSAEVVDALDLEACLLEVGNDPPHRARSICSGKDMLVHEHAPDKVFIVVVAFRVTSREASDLEVERAVVRKEVVHLCQELVVVPDAHVLGHLHRGDDVEGLGGDVKIEEILQKNVDLAIVSDLLGHPVSVSLLVTGHQDACDVRALAGQVVGQPPPASTNIHCLVPWLHAQGVSDEVELLELGAPHGLVGARVNGSGVHHRLAKCGFEPIVTLVVGFWKILRILPSPMKHRACQPSLEIAAQLDLAENRWILTALKNMHEIPSSIIDVVFQRLAQSRTTHVVALCFGQGVRLEKNKAGKDGQNDNGGDDDHPTHLLVHGARRYHEDGEQMRKPLRYKDHYLKNRQAHLNIIRHLENEACAPRRSGGVSEPRLAIWKMNWFGP